MYAWRALIGVISPNAVTAEQAFHTYAPDGVAINCTKIVSNGPRKDSLLNLSAQLEDATRLLARFQHDVIIFSCTAGSFIGGLGFDKECIERIEKVGGGAKGLTTSTALLEAYKKLGASKTAMLTPYPDEINEIEAGFLRDNGVDVLRYASMRDFEQGKWISEIDPRTVYRNVKKMDLTGADSIFISCTGLNAMGVIRTIETDFGLPVLTSNQVSLWGALRHARVGERIPELGVLFTDY